jgi:hypothetical protein
MLKECWAVVENSFGSDCRNREEKVFPMVVQEILRVKEIRTHLWHKNSPSPLSVDNPVHNFMRAYGIAWISWSSLQNAYLLGICPANSAPLHMVVWTSPLGLFYAFLGTPP